MSSKTHRTLHLPQALGNQDFSGGPLIKILLPSARGVGPIPGREAKDVVRSQKTKT